MPNFNWTGKMYDTPSQPIDKRLVKSPKRSQPEPEGWLMKTAGFLFTWTLAAPFAVILGGLVLVAVILGGLVLARDWLTGDQEGA